MKARVSPTGAQTGAYLLVSGVSDPCGLVHFAFQFRAEAHYYRSVTHASEGLDVLVAAVRQVDAELKAKACFVMGVITDSNELTARLVCVACVCQAWIGALC